MRVEEKVTEVLQAIKIICDDPGVKIQGNSSLKQLAYFWALSLVLFIFCLKLSLALGV